MTQPIRIDIWSDIACPWCYLGKRRLEVALAQLPDQPVEVVWHSYQLSPDLPADFTGAHANYLRKKLGWDAAQYAASGERLRALGADCGIDYNFADNQVANTHKAHELLHFAADQGQQDAVAEAVFRAHFTAGKHIGRIEDLIAIAEEAGLDPEAARDALQSGAHAGAVEADKAEAARIGVSGVPFFVLQGKYALSGAQEPETFLRALKQVAQEQAV